MKFNSVKRSNNITAGKAIADASADVYDTSRRTAPDFTSIAKTSINARSAERVAATRAETQVARQGIASKAFVKGTKQKLASEKKVNNTLGGARRFAGIVGGLGTIATAGIMGQQAAKEAAEDKASRDALAQTTEQQFQSYQTLLDGYKDKFSTSAPGEFNSDAYTYDPLVQGPGGVTTQSQLSGGGTSGSESQTAVSSTVKNVGDYTSNYMSTLGAAGLGDEASAALVGHLQYESGDFQHLEELEPNAYGTRGYGHLQWTDVPGGSSRRSDFLSYSQERGLKPSSFEANSGFLVHEMQTNFNGSWTNGGSWEGLKGINDFDTASQYLQDNYIRPAPATANTSQRRANGRAILSSWQAQ